MELKLFDWETWEGDEGCTVFFDCTLKVQIGEHPPGTKFHAIGILNEDGVLELFKEDTGVAFETYELSYKIGAKL